MQQIRPRVTCALVDRLCMHVSARDYIDRGLSCSSLLARHDMATVDTRSAYINIILQQCTHRRIQDFGFEGALAGG